MWNGIKNHFMIHDAWEGVMRNMFDIEALDSIIRVLTMS
jgi:hypothetical protein